MFRRLFAWIKKNRPASLVIAVLAVLLLSNWWSNLEFSGVTGVGGVGGIPEFFGETSGEKGTADSGGAQGRVTIEESSLALVVKDVRNQADEVIGYAVREGGFMVSSALDSPEESPLATVVVRVPAAKLKAAVEYYRTLAVKVSSESLIGTDVTQSYADLSRRITTLEDTIDQFEGIKARATRVADLLTITRQIITLQEEIDVLKGQKKFIEDSAAYSKITVYLAADELALPYQPPEGFRPGVVFKLAVRSLLSNVYAVGTGLIWIAVYGVIWLPVLLIIRYLFKKAKIL